MKFNITFNIEGFFDGEIIASDKEDALAKIKELKKELENTYNNFEPISLSEIGKRIDDYRFDFEVESNEESMYQIEG